MCFSVISESNNPSITIFPKLNEQTISFDSKRFVCESVKQRGSKKRYKAKEESGEQSLNYQYLGIFVVNDNDKSQNPLNLLLRISGAFLEDVIENIRDCKKFMVP